MKAKHALVVGDSGAGKTTYLRELFARHDGVAIWINHNGVSGIDGRSHDHAQTVTSRRQMDSAVSNCPTTNHVRNLRLNYRCTDAVDGAEVARAFAQDVGQHFSQDVETLVILDEAQAALPDNQDSSAGAGNPVAGMLHEDRNQAVKCVLATQDPQDVYYPPIKQCRHIVWVGQPSTFHRGFLRYYNLRDVGLPSEPYHYAVIRPVEPPEVVARGQTDPQFG